MSKLQGPQTAPPEGGSAGKAAAEPSRGFASPPEIGGAMSMYKLSRRLQQRRSSDTPLVQPKAGWSEGGQNASETSIGTIRRIPLEGLSSVIAERATGKGRAIAVFQKDLDPTQPVEVFLLLHGHDIGYHSEKGTPRDSAIDRIEPQLAGSGRTQMIGLLPQGTGDSDFSSEKTGATGNKSFDGQLFVDEVLERLDAQGLLSPKPSVHNVILSAHSGGGDPLGQMLEKGLMPKNLGEVVLFDAINGAKSELPRIEAWLLQKLGEDLRALKQLVASPQGQLQYLSRSLRFRAYHTKGGLYGSLHEPKAGANQQTPLPQDIPSGTAFIPLREFLNRWFSEHDAELGEATVKNKFRDNYQVIDTKVPSAEHNYIVGHGELQKELSGLPTLARGGPGSAGS